MIQIQSARKRRFKMDMAPLIDVVFLLLIFFMLTFAVLGQGMDIQLPDGESAPQEAVIEEDLNVLIDPNNQIRLNGQIIPLEQFKETLEHKLAQRQDKLVTLEAQRTTKFNLFAQVLDLSRDAGATDFNIIR